MGNPLRKQISYDVERFFDLSKDAYVILSMDGQLLFSNHTLATSLGYIPEAFLAYSLEALMEKIIYPDDRIRLVTHLEMLQGSHHSLDFEIRHYCKDGTIKWFSWSSTVVVSDQKIYLVGRDITAKKNIEVDLQRREKRLHTCINHMPDCFAIFNSVRDDAGRIVDFIIIDTNEAACQNNGVPKEEQLGRRLLSLFPGNLESGLFDAYCRVIETGDPLYLESLPYNDNGPYKKTKSAYEIFAIKLGDGVAVYWRNITKKKQMEEALRLSEERFHTAFHRSPHMKSIVRLPDLRYIDVNQRFLMAKHYSREEVIGKTLTEMGVHQEELTLILQKLEQGEAVENFEATLIKKDRAPGTCLLSAERIEINGEPCILFAYNDITEIKRMQSELVRLDQLHLVGEMAAGIGHEVRNPMTTVRGFLQLLSHKDGLDSYMQQFSLMIEELDRANAIITEFLSLARNKPSEPLWQDLNDVLKNIIPLIQANALNEDKDVVFLPGKIPVVNIDAKEITQLVLNLCRNGLQAMPKGGRITLKTVVESDAVLFSVQDQGSGIPPQNIPKLGIPFFTTKDDGTGLGLAICYNIAVRHNAKIDVKSGPQGTTFFVRFLRNIPQVKLGDSYR